MENQDNKQENKTTEEESIKARRDFLKKSSYAVYATPVLTSLVIDAHAGKKSGGKGGKGDKGF